MVGMKADYGCSKLVVGMKAVHGCSKLSGKLSGSRGSVCGVLRSLRVFASHPKSIQRNYGLLDEWKTFAPTGLGLCCRHARVGQYGHSVLRHGTFRHSVQLSARVVELSGG